MANDELIFRCKFIGANGKLYTKKHSQAKFVNWISDRHFTHPRYDDLYEITIPIGITSIGIGAFRNRIKLKKVTFCDGLKEIHSSAFENCTALETLCIPKTVEEIGYEAFKGCSSLKLVEVHSRYIYIHENAFDEGVEIRYM